MDALSFRRRDPSKDAGRAADRYGLQAPVVIMAVCAIAGTLLALFLRETAPIRRAAAP